MTNEHQAIWDEQLDYGERKPRVVRCTCGWTSARDYDVRIKPAFAEHKRAARTAKSAEQ